MMLSSAIALLTASSLVALISAQDGNWVSNWAGAERFLGSAFEVDPSDPRAMMRGSGSVTLGNGIAKFNGSPRLYLSQEAGVEGWENVEMTAYAKYVNQGVTPYQSYSGFTMATRSSHDLYKVYPCEAFGYYARIYQETGQCSFQKEYYHSQDSGTVYSATKRVDCFPGGVTLGQWIGMKFKVTTEPGTSNVLLQMWVDANDNGNWELKHSVTDTPGYWLSTSSTTVPSQCPQNDGDTVLRPGNVSMLRTDGRDTSTEVHWRDVSMINSLPTTSSSSPTASPTNNLSSASPTLYSVTKYICNKNFQSDADICAAGLPIAEPCLNQGDSCGGPKTCWIKTCDNTGSPPTSTPAPTPPTNACTAPACTDYTSRTVCVSCGCSWKGGCSA